MIIKGKSRTGPEVLGPYLQNAEKNEHVTVKQIKGTVAQDLIGALTEMDAYSEATLCEKPLYHAIISPQPPHRLSDAQLMEAVDALEAKLRFNDHARVVVMHVKFGREHFHVVWTRIDTERGKAVHLSQNYLKHEEVARDLERRFGHEFVQGAHAERTGKERPDRSPSRSELRLEKRTGIKAKDVTEEVTKCFRASDSGKAFIDALEDVGYIVAKGDRRDFIIVDKAGGTHSLARRISGVKAADLREFMRDIDPSQIPSADQAAGIILDRKQQAETEAEALAAVRRAESFDDGQDYATQSAAALKQHEANQAKQEFNFFSDDIIRRMRDYMARYPEEFPDQSNAGSVAEPDLQKEAPGGGHTRSR